MSSVRVRLIKFVTYSLAVILIALLLIKPFNYFCSLTSKCSSLILSYYLPTKKGKHDFEINLLAQNQLPDVEFRVITPKIKLNSGQSATIIYTAKNLTNHKIKIRPGYFIEPEDADDYIERYECLCFKEHILAPNQEIQMPFRFKIDPKIDDNQYFYKNNIITIGYKL